jgi:hypothetical protein
MKQVVGFCPTGWHAKMKKDLFPSHAKGPCRVVEVPYSEHSNYDVRWCSGLWLGWVGVGWQLLLVTSSL